MKTTSYFTIAGGLDQLFFSPLIKGETIEIRRQTIEAFLSQNGWTWDEYLARDAEETAYHEHRQLSN